MVETRHPDVFIVERPAQNRIAGVGVTTGAMVGYTKKGSIEKPDLVTSFAQFTLKYGSYYLGSPMVHAVKGFFDQGGARLFIVRVVGSGYAEAERDFVNMASVGTAAEAFGSEDLVTTPTDLSIKKYINLSIDGTPYGDIDLSGATPAATLGSEIVSNINTAVGSSVASLGVGGVLKITSPTTGLTSEVELAPVVAPSLPATFTGTGFDGTALNSGNKTLLLNIDGNGDVTVDLSTVAGFVPAGPSTVVVADVITAINSAIDATPGYGGPAGPYASAATLSVGQIKITGVDLGPTASILVKVAPAGTDARLEVFGLPEGTGIISYFGSTQDATEIVFGPSLPEGFTYTFTGSSALPEFMKILAINPGEWGNAVGLTTQRWASTTTAIVSTGAVEVSSSSIKDAVVGDIIVVEGSGSRFVKHINEIDIATKKLKFTGNAYLGAPIAIGATIKCSTSHKLVTELVDPIVASVTTEVKLLAASAVSEGMRLVLDDFGVNPLVTIVVKSVNGSIIKFDPIPTSVAAGAVVSSMHFNLLVKDGGILVEEHKFLSAQEDDIFDYFEVRLSGDKNESKYIKAETLPVAIPDPFYSNPEPVLDVLMSGGLDGTIPGPIEHLGTESPKSGMFLLEDNDEFVMFAFPGITDIFTVRSAIGFAEKLGRVMFITEAPLSDDEPLEVIEYRDIELAISSSYGVLYYPWIKVQDPLSNNPQATVIIPPSGHVMGVWSEVAQRRGVHKAPAGLDDGNLFTVLGLTYTVTDGEQDLLNEKGINVIRFYRGSGIVIWGTRTLYNLIDGFHYLTTRRVMNFVKESMKRGNRFAIFEPNQPELWDRLTIINTEFLKSLWFQGMLFPSDDVSSAFFFICDASTNPESERILGRVNCKAGIRVPYPAEFIVIEIGLMQDSSTVTETVGFSGL